MNNQHIEEGIRKDQRFPWMTLNMKLKKKLFARQIIWDKDSERWKFKAWKKRVLNIAGEEGENGLEFDTTLLISPSDFDNKYGLSETLTMGELNDFIHLQKSY